MSPVDAITGKRRRTPEVQDTKRSSSFETALDAYLQAQANPIPAPAPVDLPDGSVRFSRHARSRLDELEMSVSESQYRSLEEGVERLNERGAREALVIMGELALVVGVPRRVVITVTPLANAMGTIFTDIDSTLLLEDR